MLLYIPAKKEKKIFTLIFFLFRYFLVKIKKAGYESCVPKCLTDFEELRKN
jgi:hypothetical protein